jgi:hypothetical protein
MQNSMKICGRYVRYFYFQELLIFLLMFDHQLQYLIFFFIINNTIFNNFPSVLYLTFLCAT